MVKLKIVAAEIFIFLQILLAKQIFCDAQEQGLKGLYELSPIKFMRACLVISEKSVNATWFFTSLSILIDAYS